MKTQLPRSSALLTLLLVTGASFAQGQGRHAAARSGPAASPAGLAYGSGYQARRTQQAEREAPRARQATPKADDRCAPATAPTREPDAAHPKEPGQPPAPARREACTAHKP